MYMVQCPIHRNRKVVMHHQAEGRNEIETNRNEINENETKRNEINKCVGETKKCDDRTDKRTNVQQKSYIPLSFFGGGIQILSKIYFRNLKIIYISCKSTFFPFDPFSYL